MVRRIAPQPGDMVLVTAAKSNTSLFAIAALRRVLGIAVYALSTSNRFADRIAALGVRELIVADPTKAPLIENPAIQAIMVGNKSGFAGVIDPYADLYLPHMPAIMGMGARYTTCGFYDQYLGLVGKQSPRPPASMSGALVTLMMRNLSIIGNCIGTTADLDRAIADYASGELPVAIDSVIGGGDSGAFLDRTYNASDRFGKVIFAYD
jgi:NADPH:quinone reductase-like Zn-dependent oxidoreductase